MKCFAIILFTALASVLLISTAEAVSFNGREYTEIASEWYETYLGVDYKLDGTEILVNFNQGVTSTQIDSLNTALAGETVRILKNGTYLIKSTASTPPDALDICEDYLDSYLVSSGHNNPLSIFNNPNDEYFYTQQYLEDDGEGFDNDINWVTAWEIESGDPDVKIGVMDSGLLWWHPDMLEPGPDIYTNIWQNLGAQAGDDWGEDADHDGQVIVWDEEGDVWMFDDTGWNGVDNNGDLNDADNDDEYIGDSLNIFSDLDSYVDVPYFSEYTISLGSTILTVPQSFMLDQNYPNPFNSETLVNYGLPQSAETGIRVYDISGRLVRELYSGNREAGYHKAMWDGLGSDGFSVSSGIYFIEMRSIDGSEQSFRKVNKMMLIR